MAVLAAVKGLLASHSDIPVSYVNALEVAAERGLEVRTIGAPEATDHLNVVRLSGGGHSIAGTLSRIDQSTRITELDGHQLEIRPSAHMLVLRNRDTPGMVGVVGNSLGDAGINISNMHIGERGDGLDALMVVGTADPVPPAVQEVLRAHEHVSDVRAINT